MLYFVVGTLKGEHLYFPSTLELKKKALARFTADYRTTPSGCQSGLAQWLCTGLNCWESKTKVIHVVSDDC